MHMHDMYILHVIYTVGCKYLLHVEGLIVTLRWRTAIKALFLCFGFCLVCVGILCHEIIHHIPSFFLQQANEQLKHIKIATKSKTLMTYTVQVETWYYISLWETSGQTCQTCSLIQVDHCIPAVTIYIINLEHLIKVS